MTDITKQLAAMEDIAQGEGAVVQKRSGQDITVHRIDVPFAVSSEAALSALDQTKYSKARLYSAVGTYSDYYYNELIDTGIPSDTGLGSWLALVNSDYAPTIYVGLITKSFSSVADMQAGSSSVYKQGEYLSSGQTTWKVVAAVTPIELPNSLYAESVGTVYTDDFTASDLTLAISTVQTGQTLQLGLQAMTGNIAVTRSNITIKGLAMPAYAFDALSLVGGSIIRGTFIVDGDNVTCQDFGVDCGVTACNDLNAGQPMEGFIAHDVTQNVLRRNNRFNNISGLCRASTDLTHAVLIEGQEDGSADNIHGRRGSFGVVFKVARFNIGKVTGYEVNETGCYIKSDSYAPVQQVNASQLNYFDLGANATQPVAIHASTAPLQDVNVDSINVDGGDRQVRLISNTSGVNVLDNVNIAKINARDAISISFDTFGVCYNCNITEANLIASVSGKFVLTSVDARNVHLGVISCIDTLGVDSDEAVKLAGTVSFDNIIACQNYNYDAPIGIYLVVATPGGLKASIGTYIGRLNLELAAADLQNGWTTAFGQAVGCTVKNNTVSFFGRLNPNNVGVGNELFFALDPFLVPFTQRNFTCDAVASSDINNSRKVAVTVSNGGAVEFPGLNNVDQWPNTGVTPAATYIDLASITFDLSDLIY